MTALIAISPDGVRVAYDVQGSGPPVVLLHGGGLMSRLDWHNAGYVERLLPHFQVIAIDLRGNGESDKPLRPEDYSVEKHCLDILAVADACGAERFSVWGFSLGGNIGRYLAAESPRVSSLIMIGVTFGPGVSGEFRQLILNFRDHWLPILQAQKDGTLDVESLPSEDQEQLEAGHVPLTIAQATGMLAWGHVEPRDVRCPALWLAGSRNEPAISGIREYRKSLEGTKVRVQVVEGLDHMEEFYEVDQVFPLMQNFTLGVRHLS